MHAPDDVLSVAVLAFPDGTARWVQLPDGDGDRGGVLIRENVSAWRAALTPAERARTDVAGLCGGVTMIVMLRECFERVPLAQRVPLEDAGGLH